MELKNIIAAVTLSIAIIVFYTLFFQPSPEELNKMRVQKEKKELAQSSDAPSLDGTESLTKLSRKEALTQNERIFFENENIIGSISLKGASIDDLIFKNYKIELDQKE